MISLLRQCIFVHAAAYCHTRDAILRIGTADLHRVYDNMLQRAQKCTNVQGRSFSAPSLTSKYFAFEFV